jgi:hypothetical protein
VITLEQLFTSREGFGVENATPVQRAACRASDGKPLGELWKDAQVRAAFGGTEPPEGMPFEIVILGGERGGKSMFAGAGAVRATQNCDVSKLSKGDIPRVPVVSTDKDAAEATFNHIAQNVTQKPLLRQLLIREPTGDTIWLRHPSGLPVEIKVVALSKHASTLVSRWFASVIFDESTRMASESGGVKNLTEARRAVRARILKGGQMFNVGSPYAPMGPVFDLVQKRFGKPTNQCVVVRATGPMMNPTHYTPEFCEDLRLSDDASYRINVLCEFLDSEEAFFSSVEIERAIRSGPAVLPPNERLQYVATMDPATRGNGWTLTIGTCTGFGGPGGAMPLYKIAVARQWMGSKASPLNADHVLSEIARLCAEYGISHVVTDQWAVDLLAVIAERHGLTLSSVNYNTEQFVEMCETLKLHISSGCLELPPEPYLRQDLVTTRKQATMAGYRVRLARSADGRHGDYVPPLALFAAYPPGPPLDEPDRGDRRMARALELVKVQNQGDQWEQIAGRMAS